MEQSPIEIIASQTIPETGDLRPVLDLELPRATRFINTGRTLQLEFARGEGMVIGGTRYELLNVHFHAPAEHVIDGKTYAMEAHVVTLDRNSQTPSAAVLGVFLDVEQAAANPLLATVLDGFPEARPGQNCVVTPNVPVDLELARDGLPDSTGLWTYEGSLTTPSCGEFVRFFLYNEPMPVSQAQVEQFKRVVGQPVTARPVQPLNGRQVTTLP